MTVIEIAGERFPLDQVESAEVVVDAEVDPVAEMACGYSRVCMKPGPLIYRTVKLKDGRVLRETTPNESYR